MAHTRALLPSVASILLTVSIGAAPARAQSPDAWTTVGSAGTVDEADLTLVQLGTPVPGAVSMRPVLRGTVHVRYNVVAVGGVVNAPSLALQARLLDGGDAQRVVLRLKEYGFHTGLTTTLLTLDSDTFPASPAFQLVSTDGCSAPFTTLNFTDNAYFVDVELSRSLFRPPVVVDPPTTNAPFALLELRPVVDLPGTIAPLPLLEPVGGGPALGAIRLDTAVCLF
jgi:hypothetical protein